MTNPKRARAKANKKLHSPVNADVSTLLAKAAAVFDALPEGSFITFSATPGVNPKIISKSGVRDSLEYMQAEVHGYLESVDGLEVYCNEEGLMKNLPLNIMVSELLQQHIVGNVVVKTSASTRDIAVRLLAISARIHSL